MCEINSVFLKRIQTEQPLSQLLYVLEFSSDEMAFSSVINKIRTMCNERYTAVIEIVQICNKILI